MAVQLDAFLHVFWHGVARTWATNLAGRLWPYLPAWRGWRRLALQVLSFQSHMVPCIPHVSASLCLGSIQPPAGKTRPPQASNTLLAPGKLSRYFSPTPASHPPRVFSTAHTFLRQVRAAAALPTGLGASSSLAQNLLKRPRRKSPNRIAALRDPLPLVPPTARSVKPARRHLRLTQAYILYRHTPNQLHPPLLVVSS